MKLDLARLLAPPPHWTPRYVADRLSLELWERSHPHAPWLAPRAVEFLHQWMRPTDVIVEFGSGRSTAWFAEHARHVISVEHDPAWFQRVDGMLRPPPGCRVERFRADATPEAYVGAADKALSGQADLILVDGEVRDHCARWALGKLRPGGLLVIDNANWYLPSSSRAPSSVPENGEPGSEVFREVWTRVAPYRRVWFGNGVTETLVIWSP